MDTSSINLSIQPHNLTQLTIPQIKEWAKQNGIKVPSGLKKIYLVQYVLGAYQEKLTGGNKAVRNSVASIDVLEPRYVNPSKTWQQHLLEYGWTVIPIPNWNPLFTQQFLSWFESCSSNFKSNDHTTWISKNMPMMLHGILKNYFGHTELQWKIRELCAPIFAQIWGCNPEELLCSFDGGCFLPCIPKEELKNTGFKQWFHVDQMRSVLDFCSVQGIVNFEDNDFEDGGLILVEDSHKVFPEYMAKHPSEGITWAPGDMSDPLLSTRKLIKICAKRGEIILFDSRTFHCNIHPFGSKMRSDGSPRFRMCTYVAMQPRRGASEKELAKRRLLYEKGRMTGHWCYGLWFKETSEHPRTYGKCDSIIRPTTIEIAVLNDLTKRLVGY